MDNIIFESMDAADFQKIYEIEKSAYPIPWTESVMHDAFLSDYIKIKMQSQDEIIGYAFLACILDEAHLFNFAVHPRLQGKGYGTFFLNHILNLVLPAKIETVFLEVRHSNTRAYELYLKMGFNEIGLRRNYYPKGKDREDAIVMAYAFIR